VFFFLAVKFRASLRISLECVCVSLGYIGDSGRSSTATIWTATTEQRKCHVGNSHLNRRYVEPLVEKAFFYSHYISANYVT
jgi:hypothetical protein